MRAKRQNQRRIARLLARSLATARHGMFTRHGARSLFVVSVSLVATPSLSTAAEPIADETPSSSDSIDRPPPARAARRRPAHVADSPRAGRAPPRIRCRRLSAVRRLRAAPDGRLTFLSAVGGSRYVRRAHGATWRGCSRSRSSAHELQHAVEIAERRRSSIGASLAREYQRIGYVNPWSTLPRRLRSTRAAAVRAGEQVLKELIAGRTMSADRWSMRRPTSNGQGE